MTSEELTRLQELVYELRVRNVIGEKLITVTSGMPMRKLRGILRDNRISGVPVVADDVLVGIISIEDFIRWFAENGPDCSIAERMSENVVTVYSDEPLMQAVNKLERYGYGRLPVVDRKTGKLAGVITKGDIIAGMLKKLEIDNRLAELRNARSRHIFEDIIAEKSALTFEYKITGGDFQNAGNSSTNMKTTLLRLGIEPRLARRAAVVTYEAEMNVIFYAETGHIRVNVNSSRIRVVVKDVGQGIPDIKQAMQPGYSTAPEWVRELGFGAGMGLGNIRRYADTMRIHSTVGKGTRLEIVLNLGEIE